MKIEYTDLEKFCDARNLTYEDFGRLANGKTPAERVHWSALYKVITGRKNPGKKTRRVLDAFVAANRAEIRRAIC